MKKLFTLALAAVCALTICAQGMKSKLYFSTDKGQTWSEDLPILKKNDLKFSVKLVGTISEERQVNGNIVLSRLFSTTDFASSTGYDTINNRRMFAQKLKLYYASSKREFTYVYNVDLGERKAGVIGIENKWDKKSRKWVNAPLPAVKAYAPGDYMMGIHIYWRAKENSKLVLVSKPVEFTVTIEE